MTGGSTRSQKTGRSRLLPGTCAGARLGVLVHGQGSLAYLTPKMEEMVDIA